MPKSLLGRILLVAFLTPIGALLLYEAYIAGALMFGWPCEVCSPPPIDRY